MATFTEWPNGQQALTTVESFWFTPLLAETQDGELILDPYTPNYNGGTGPWTVTLTASLIDASGQVVSSGVPLATYATGYNFHIAAVNLAGGGGAVLYDEVDPTNPNTGVDILAQAIDAAGDPVGGATTLETNVSDVLQFRVATDDGGESFDLTYAVVASGEATVYSQIFDADGQASGNANIVDSYTTVNGKAFNVFALAFSNNSNPSYVYIREASSGVGTANYRLRYELVDSSGQATTSLKTIAPDYPTGSTSNQLLSWTAQALQSSPTSDPLFAVAMRYSYTLDGATSAAIDVRTYDAITGVSTGDVVIPVPTGSAGETLNPLAGGGFVLGYGGAELNTLQAFDASGAAVGADFALPANETDFNLGQLPDGQIVVEWPSAETGGDQLNYDIFTQTVCFCAGTRILTNWGEIEVEKLAVGDLVATASGALRPVRWLGHRRLDGRRHPRPRDVMPIRIAAHAFATGKPARDLYLSPAHAICVSVVDEVLIPAMALVNGSTVQQIETGAIDYWHVELDRHDILIAENLAAESYIDMGNRSFFSESRVVGLGCGPDPERRSDADYCRPFHHSGKLVEVVRAQLGARAEALGWRLRRDPFADLHLRADGVRIDPDLHEGRARFKLPAGAKDVWLTSLSARPRDAGIGDDERRLGVCLGGLSVQGVSGGFLREIPLDAPGLDDGFHRLERDGEFCWRWTSGEARLPPALWADVCGDFVIGVDLIGEAVPRWAPPEAAKRAA